MTTLNSSFSLADACARALFLGLSIPCLDARVSLERGDRAKLILCPLTRDEERGGIGEERAWVEVMSRQSHRGGARYVGRFVKPPRRFVLRERALSRVVFLERHIVDVAYPEHQLSADLTVPQRVQQIRKRVGSGVALAALLGCTPDTVSLWALGKRIMGAETEAKLAQLEARFAQEGRAA